MSIKPVSGISLSSKDVKILSALCNCILDVHGYERKGSYNLLVKLDRDRVIVSAVSGATSSATVDKIIDVNSRSVSTVWRFFYNFHMLWSKRPDVLNVIMINVNYIEDEKPLKEFKKVEFFKMNKITPNIEHEVVLFT